MNYILTKCIPSFIRIRLEGRTALQKILANTGWLFVDKILRMGVGLLVGVWVARYLGPEQFGLYNYALSFVALFSAFATLGLDGIVVRDIVRDPSYKNEILGTAFILKLLGGISTLILAVGAVSLLRPHDNLTRWLVGIIAAGTIFQAFDVIDFWFQSQVQSKYTVYAKNVAFFNYYPSQDCFNPCKSTAYCFRLDWVGRNRHWISRTCNSISNQRILCKNMDCYHFSIENAGK